MLYYTAYHILLTAQTGLAHVRTNHMLAYARASEEEYHVVCAELIIRNEYPSLNKLDWGVAISGLDMFTKTLACGVEGCGKLFISGGVIRKHYARAHRIKGAQIPT